MYIASSNTRWNSFISSVTYPSLSRSRLLRYSITSSSGSFFACVRARACHLSLTVSLVSGDELIYLSKSSRGTLITSTGVAHCAAAIPLVR